MKKWLTFFLLLVNLMATFYSCYGKDDCCNDVQTSKNASHENHKSEGNCSPFITCSTCPGFTQVTYVVDIPTIQEVKPIHYSKWVWLTLSTYTAYLFQPPRIA